MTRGKYIVVEGAEGVGKTTMIQLIHAQLQAAGLPVKIMREPDSQNDLTARAIRQLTQDPRFPMNTRTEVLLYNAARAQSLEVIRTATSNGVTCLVDRSYLTTLAVQYYGRGDVPDYEKINDIIDFAVQDMQPDLMVVLDAPVSVLRDRVKQRHNGDRFDNLDESFLERIRAGYLWEAKQRNLPVVYATDDTESVFKQVWKLVTETLALRDGKESKPQSVAEVLANKPLIKAAAAEAPAQKSSPAPEPTPEPAPEAPKTAEPAKVLPALAGNGTQDLHEIVTNTEDSVYSFTGAISPLKAAAAMAHMSRQGGDVRTVILDDCTSNSAESKPAQGHTKISYYEDSVRGLTGQRMVVENASNLLARILEKGRLATYIEQSTRYIPYEAKDKDGHYRYFVPPELKGKVRSQYIRTMNQLFEHYAVMLPPLLEYVRSSSSTPQSERDDAWEIATKIEAQAAIRQILPLAAATTVGMSASGQSMEQLVISLLANDLPEAQKVGGQILTELRKVAPALYETTDKPDRGGATVAYRASTRAAVRKMANELLPANYTTETSGVRLVSHSHPNELDIVPDMLYEHSDLPLETLRSEVATWPYQRKLEVFNAYMGDRQNRWQKPGRALEKIHYSWDIVCDYDIFRGLERHRMVEDLQWQALSPRYGYNTPELVEAAGLSDQFDACFDLSLQLYSAMQAANFALEAQYATLFGHRMRWKVTYNAREAFHLHELRTSPGGHPRYHTLVLAMHEKLAEIHPLLAEAMKFVDPK